MIKTNSEERTIYMTIDKDGVWIWEHPPQWLESCQKREKGSYCGEFRPNDRGGRYNRLSREMIKELVGTPDIAEVTKGFPGAMLVIGVSEVLYKHLGFGNA